MNTQVIYNNSTKQLSIESSIVNDTGDTIVGYSIIGVKINGKTFCINDSNTVEILDGAINLTIDLPEGLKVHNVTLVTGDTSIYNGRRETITEIQEYNELYSS